MLNDKCMYFYEGNSVEVTLLVFALYGSKVLLLITGIESKAIKDCGNYFFKLFAVMC